MEYTAQIHIVEITFETLLRVSPQEFTRLAAFPAFVIGENIMDGKVINLSDCHIQPSGIADESLAIEVKQGNSRYYFSRDTTIMSVQRWSDTPLKSLLGRFLDGLKGFQRG